mmetsp:Transcript_20497/g.42331  ORF Transcript_20497/g.42331 Transcript_20497/m.42331 type:complete len:544 (+) Transcript_20497:77-1708(+)
MWGNLGDRLAGLGDVLTQQASAHAKRQHEQQQQQQQQQQQTSSDPSSTSTSSSSKAVADGGTVVQLPPSPSEIPDAAAPSFGSRWANPLASLTSQPPPQPPSSPPADQPPQAPSAVLGSLRNWTGSVVSATNKLVETTRETLEKEQIRLQSSAPSLFSHSRRPYKRDVSLPLDVEALRDAEVVYITDRIVTLSHPFLQSTTDGDITPERKLAAVGHLLRKRHGGRYMIWNLSEVEYDADVLDDQVLVYKFPGSPSPPLGLLLKLLLSMESWLKADERNVAVIHCLTGRGRTSTVLAAFLCWTGEAGFSDVNVALEYIARCKRCAVETLTIPSQVRYVSYFANMLDGVRPSQPPLMLKRIIMSEAPKVRETKVVESFRGRFGSLVEVWLHFNIFRYHFYFSIYFESVWKATPPHHRNQRLVPRILRPTPPTKEYPSLHRSHPGLRALPPNLQSRHPHLHHGRLHELHPNQRRLALLHRQRRTRLLPHRIHRPGRHPPPMPAPHPLRTTNLHVPMRLSHGIRPPQGPETDQGAIGRGLRGQEVLR